MNVSKKAKKRRKKEGEREIALSRATGQIFICG